jgi:hypothetical protein
MPKIAVPSRLTPSLRSSVSSGSSASPESSSEGGADMPAARTLNCDLLIHQAHRLTLRRQISQLEGRAVFDTNQLFFESAE